MQSKTNKQTNKHANMKEEEQEEEERRQKEKKVSCTILHKIQTLKTNKWITKRVKRRRKSVVQFA